MLPIQIPNKKRKRGEDDICVAFVQYLTYKKLRHHHSPNEVQRGGTIGMIQRSRNKRVGVSKGFLDYIIFLPRDGELYMEVKTGKGSLSPEQKEWVRFINAETKNYAEVVYSLKEAIDTVEKYLKKA